MKDFYRKAYELYLQERDEEALKLYKKGIEADDEKCRYGYAIMLKNGYAVEKDYDGAMAIIADCFDKIKALAEDGDPEAMCIIGFYYYNGWCVEKDWQKSYEWILRGAMLENSECQLELGYKYATGDGVDQNYKIAAEWFQKAAEQGNSIAQRKLGYIYEWGEGVNQNYKIAFKWYTKSANQNNAEGLWRLGTLYQYGRGVKRDINKAFEFYSRASNLNNTDAMWRLATLYIDGEGIERNYEIAEKLLKVATEQNNIDAKRELAVLFYKTKRLSEAMAIFNELAENDNEYLFFIAEIFREQHDYKNALIVHQKGEAKNVPACIFGLGGLYYWGCGVPKDYTKAFHCYKRAADLDVLVAMHELGIMLTKGVGTECNYQEAIYWLRKAAEKGYADSMVCLGDIYENAVDFPHDYSLAMNWYEKAAEKGSGEAEWRLGLMYLEGKGVAKNTEDAMKHFLESINQYSESETSMYKMGNLYSDGSLGKVNPSLAVEWWSKACENVFAVSEEAAYKLGYAYYDGYGVKRDLEKAKYYFELALNTGYACSYAVDMVKHELGEKNLDNPMRQYADGIIVKNIPIEKMYGAVLRDLRKDFGESWDVLQKNSQKFLSTSVVCYIALYSMGKHIYGNMDFTSSITPMFKALEAELGKYLYTGYINYLKENDIPISIFGSKRSFIKSEGLYSFSYRDPDDLSEFTLGSLHLVIGLEKNARESIERGDRLSRLKGKADIDSTMLEYIKTIFKDDAFGDINIDRAITDYLVDLSRDIRSITDSIRNPAAHSNVMSCSKAETCANHLFKAQKLLCKFLEKIRI